MRTEYCGNIRLLHIDKEVTLCGWVDSKRDFKNLIFVNLRDYTGIVQILFNFKNKKKLKKALILKNEFCIKISGIVRKRLPKNINKMLPTGEIEILVYKLKIFNSSNSLPINIKNNSNEKHRLKYRYLDLRNPIMLKNLKIRSQVTNIITNIMQKKNFLNIETPYLTKSTPEGANNYLISSDIKNKFYALPQSPQLFKQLLMISGVDKYYQIVKCFRNEDLRSDRQPEFTQIDIEASFVDSLKIRNITEIIIQKIWKKILSEELKKIPIIPFNKSISKYGCDKPDLRNPLKLVDVNDIIPDIFKKSSKKNILTRSVSILIPKGLILLNQDKINLYNNIIKKNKYINSIYIKVKNLELGLKGIFTSINKIFDIQNLTNIIKKNNAKNGDIILILSGENKLINKISSNFLNIIGNDIKIIKKNIWKPVWIVDFPMFKKDNGILSSVHHPFTAPKHFTSIENMKSNPESIISNAYDLVMNGYEIGGGSVRINNYKMQKNIFNILGISILEQKKEFGFFINALKYGTPPHAGIALGLDRIIMLLTRSDNIKDVIAFPKSNSGNCIMTGAPTKIKKNKTIIK